MGPPLTWGGRFGAKWWPVGRVEQPPPTFSIDLGFSSLCRCVATKARAELPQTLAGRPLCPLSLGYGPLGPCVKYTPRGDDEFDILSTSPCHPLKCSNLAPEFLKSNKH
jgi:hypothetical protein